MSTHNTNNHEHDTDFPCATCNRWSTNCCGPWETPDEHDD